MMWPCFTKCVILGAFGRLGVRNHFGLLGLSLFLNFSNDNSIIDVFSLFIRPNLF